MGSKFTVGRGTYNTQQSPRVKSIMLYNVSVSSSNGNGQLSHLIFMHEIDRRKFVNKPFLKTHKIKIVYRHEYIGQLLSSRSVDRTLVRSSVIIWAFSLWHIPVKCINIFTCLLTRRGICVGNWIYWTLTNRNYNQSKHYLWSIHFRIHCSTHQVFLLLYILNRRWLGTPSKAVDSSGGSYTSILKVLHRVKLGKNMIHSLPRWLEE
jgi:hypothetical protein